MYWFETSKDKSKLSVNFEGYDELSQTMLHAS